MLQHRRRINNHSQVFSDEKLKDLCSSNSSSFKLMKIIRDGYETIKELCDMEDKQDVEYKRKIMFYEGTLHARGMMEEFIGYLQEMMAIGLNSSKTNSVISRIVNLLDTAVFRNNLNDYQICLLKRIGIHFLQVDENKIKVEKY
ncbi:unnamed protein product [Rotaria sp. Silwood1]|nr:unnamed protein product [Rotaria sp. Silwood1]CAF1689117.1 unnamed protein product [Rotaria sp. Silwood1]